jgi:hypothetical protein
MPGKGQLYKTSYGMDVSKDGTQMPLIILDALRQNPGVVQRTQSVNTSAKGDRYAVPMRKGK